VLCAKADTVIVGGGMAYTFQASQGRTIGSSLFDASYLEQCAQLLAAGNVVIPSDALGLASGADFGTGGPDPALLFGLDIPDGFVGLDIGPATVDAFEEVIANAATILWNGPMGVFEDSRFAGGTEAVARRGGQVGRNLGRGRRGLGGGTPTVRSRGRREFRLHGRRRLTRTG